VHRVKETNLDEKGEITYALMREIACFDVDGGKKKETRRQAGSWKRTLSENESEGEKTSI